jgi:DNA-binding transcriptional ArsR family regulator
MRGAMTVGEVVHALDGNQSNVSRHLQILYGAGIVRRRREGASVVYSLKSASVSRLCELVYQYEMSRPDIQPE